MGSWIGGKGLRMGVQVEGLEGRFPGEDLGLEHARQVSATVQRSHVASPPGHLRGVVGGDWHHLSGWDEGVAKSGGRQGARGWRVNGEISIFSSPSLSHS